MVGLIGNFYYTYFYNEKIKKFEKKNLQNFLYPLKNIFYDKENMPPEIKLIKSLKYLEDCVFTAYTDNN